MIGREILNYKIEKILGEGGMGTVYLAKHTKIPNRVSAIKVLKSNFLKNENLKNRFLREMKIMADMTHENIIKLEQFDEDGLGMYLIMEYFDGLEIDDYLKNKIGVFPEEKAIPIMIQILSAFSFAHNKGIVHRDIKPANILIDRGATKIKILDFGIAKMKDDISMQTKSGAQIGTVFYMSPEQVHGKELDARSDIYSLGVTFYQMLTGLNPYQDLNTEYEIYNKIAKEELPDPRTIYPGVSEKMVNILKKALAKNVEDRFQSCDEFIKSLESNLIIELPKPVTNNNDDAILTNNKNETPFYISLFLAIGSLISLINDEFFYFSILFAVINIFYYSSIKDEDKTNMNSIFVFGSLILSIIGSLFYFLN
jgi:serine/threonine protein kinase